MLDDVRVSRSSEIPPERIHHCPVCTQERLFFFIGVQSWPQSHRHRRDLPPELALWECSRCEASISTELPPRTLISH